jgi:hypothetical protein
LLKFFKKTYNIPILLLGFNRPDCFSKVLKKIISQKPVRLYIALDGPRNELDQLALNSIKKEILKIPIEIELKTLFRESNLGCGKAVSSAITWFFENEEMGIILEDDTLPNDTFFDFCEKMLVLYKDEPRVGHISGNNYFTYDRFPKVSHWFSCYNHIWGWASWKRVWRDYSFDLESVSEISLIKALDTYNYGNQFVSYWLDVYNKMKNKEVDTWDYQYTLMCLSKTYMSAIPRYNLVDNIGFDNRATHTKSEKPKFIQKPKNYKISEYKEKPQMKVSKENDLYVNKIIFNIA